MSNALSDLGNVQQMSQITALAHSEIATKRRKEDIIPLILHGWNDSDIARELDLSRNTVRAWRNDRYVRSEVALQRQVLRDCAIAKLDALKDIAISVLADNMRSDQEPIIRHKAAVEVLTRLGIDPKDSRLQEMVSQEVGVFLHVIEQALPPEALEQVYSAVSEYEQSRSKPNGTQASDPAGPAPRLLDMDP